AVRRRGVGAFELGAAGGGRALLRGPGAELGGGGAAREVGGALGARGRLQAPFDAHLAVGDRPVEDQGGVRVGGQLAGLAAAVVGVGDEAALVVPLEQHDARRGAPRGVGGGGPRGRRRELVCGARRVR